MLPSTIENLNGPSAADKTASDEGAIGRDDFLKMLIAQLENQDPLNPQDPTQFTEQLATFSNLEQMIGIKQGVDQLVELQQPVDGPNSTDQLIQSLTASSMVGREILAAAPLVEVTGDEGGDPTALRFELASVANDVEIEVRDLNGILVDVIGDDEISPGDAALAQGTQQIGWDRQGLNGNGVPEGVYQFEVKASNAGQPVLVQALLEGRVTGAGMGETPVLFVGNMAIPLDGVIEVRE